MVVPGEGGAPAAGVPADALAPFRPRRARVVALWAMWCSLAVFGAIAVIIPAQVDHRWGIGDRLTFFGFGVVLAALAWRYAAIRAVPSREGLVVRNLVLSRTLEWSQVVGISFGGGEPWVSLDLEEGDTLAVMAIQKADGAAAGREASRLAALVQAFGEAREPGEPDEPSGSGPGGDPS